MRFLRSIGVFSVGWMLGCSGATDEKNETTGIVGDWLSCDDDACSLLNDDGWRLDGQGLAHELDSPGGAVEEPMCVVLGENTVPYSFENGTFTLDTLAVQAELEGKILTLYDVPVTTSEGPMGTLTVRMRKIVSMTAASCPGDAPPTP